MFNQLIQFDRYLFHCINSGMANPFFDWIMPWLRNAKNWIPLYVIIVGFSLWRYGKKGVIIIVLIAASAGLADYTSASIAKPWIHRLRPCNDPVTATTDIERVIDKNGNPVCGSGYSFPSTHATDHFAMAVFMIFIFCKRWRWIWFWGILWAGLISFAQVYVGVHFPIDVFCGALYGAFTGWLMSRVFYWLQPRFKDWVPVV